MITAREKGRSLELIVGGGDDSITFLVPPIPARQGAEILALWLGVAFGATQDADANEAATKMSQIACSQEVFDSLVELRWGEQEQVINAAFMWNVQGGGLDLVNEYLSGGLPKARESLLRSAGMWEAFSLLRTSLDSELESLTSTAASPDTSTPSGGSTGTDAPSAEPIEASPR